MFRKISYSILALCFFLWLIPLGRFIDKAHESTACGGARAICLCGMHVQTSKPVAAGKMITTNTGHNEQRAPGGGAGYEFEAIHARVMVNPRFVQFPSVVVPVYHFLPIFSIDQVPKV